MNHQRVRTRMDDGASVSGEGFKSRSRGRVPVNDALEEEPSGHTINEGREPIYKAIYGVLVLPITRPASGLVDTDLSRDSQDHFQDALVATRTKRLKETSSSWYTVSTRAKNRWRNETTTPAA